MTQRADLLIQTRIELSDDQFSEVARQLRAMVGVERCERDPGWPNLIRVVYRVEQAASLTILNKLTRLGFNAALVAT